MNPKKIYQLELPGFEEDRIVESPATLQNWNLDITPQEYAKRVLALWGHDKGRSIRSAAIIANVFTLCDREAAEYITSLAEQLFLDQIETHKEL